MLLYSFLFFFYSSFLYFVFFYFLNFNSFLFEFYFLSFGGLDVTFTFIFDFLSIGFFSCVSFISGVVFFYSMFYMAGSLDIFRFTYLVFLFVLSMFFLVFSGNFFLCMVGWDGLGLISFLLVIFYPNSYSAVSGLITVFTNRVGDVFFLMSFFFMYMLGAFFFDSSSLFLFLIFFFFIFFGSITKSAQIPFSAWLPAAMAAPTPVSSLVHSSTLVTAGVYLLIRFNYIFMYFNFYFLKLFFLFTMILAGFCALIEMDLKKVIAMSTLSQLGMMLFILSSGIWILSFIHMIIHAFFKSMLFLSMGSLMIQSVGIQDSRLYGCFYFSFSSYLYFLVSCLCLSGFPFFIGFYSKDFIISSVSFFEGIFLYYFFLSGCLFTVGYSFRLIFECYFYFFKSSPFLFSKESLYFLMPSSFLFMKCWLFGGLFYWFFLFDFSFFFSILDLLMGFSLFLLGYFSYKLFLNFLPFLYFLFDILFLRWIFGGGTSHFFKGFVFYSFENTWMEMMGGGSSYLILSNFMFKIRIFEMASLGFLIFFSFLFLYHFMF